MHIQKELTELVNAGIISTDTAEAIHKYYASKNSGSSGKQLVIFGILGAVLIGLGIILIIAHNWDELSKPFKLLFAFLPLVTGQAACVYTLLKKNNSAAWRESAASFLVFAAGAAISLVSQIYNMEGNLSSFLFIWMLLCIPVVYGMQSAVASLVCIAGITWYAAETCYFHYGSGEDYYYWLLLAALLPFYYSLYRQKPASNFTVLHHWLVPLSLTVSLGTVAAGDEELLFPAYINLLGLFYIIGNSRYFRSQKAIANGYITFGSLGTAGILIFLSFDFFWEHLRKNFFLHGASPELIVTLITFFLAAAALYLQKKNNPDKTIRPFEFTFAAFSVIFVLGTGITGAAVFINLLVLTTGIFTILNGVKANHLGILNYGLVIITVLVMCRFFDSDLSFVIRGLLFVIVGAGFFGANYYLIKTRKHHA